MASIRSIYFALTLIFLSGCGPHYVDYFTHHDDGTPKPTVILLPIEVSCKAPPFTREAFNAQLRYNFLDNGEIYLFSEPETKTFLDRSGEINFNQKDFKVIQQGTCADFIVKVEILENSAYDSYPCVSLTNQFTTIKARVKAIDIRSGCPRVVLHEIMEATLRIRPARGNEREIACFKTVYERLSARICSRLESIFWCSK